MRHILLALAVLLALSVSAFAETIRATFDGKLCDFCAIEIERTFERQPGVDTVKVDLRKKLLTIQTKPGQTLSDEKIVKVLNEAGFAVTAIARGKK